MRSPPRLKTSLASAISSLHMLATQRSQILSIMSKLSVLKWAKKTRRASFDQPKRRELPCDVFLAQCLGSHISFALSSLLSVPLITVAQTCSQTLWSSLCRKQLLENLKPSANLGIVQEAMEQEPRPRAVKRPLVHWIWDLVLLPHSFFYSLS
jgi:hypothetical protein